MQEAIGTTWRTELAVGMDRLRSLRYMQLTVTSDPHGRAWPAAGHEDYLEPAPSAPPSTTGTTTTSGSGFMAMPAGTAWGAPWQHADGAPSMMGAEGPGTPSAARGLGRGVGGGRGAAGGGGGGGGEGPSMLGDEGPGSPSKTGAAHFKWDDSELDPDLKDWLDRVEPGYGEKFESVFDQFGLVRRGLPNVCSAPP